MRKIFGFLVTAAVVLAFSLPAMAQAQWSFYGSARMFTMYETVSKEVPNFLTTKQGVPASAWNAGASGVQDDSQLSWSEQVNSRIGAIVKNGDITGRFEFGGSTGFYDAASADPEGLRLLYGQWNFSKDGFIEVGRDYTPYNYVVSGMCGPGVAGYSECNGKYMGTIYGGRRAQLTVGYKGFQFALVDPTVGVTPYKLNPLFPGAASTNPATAPLVASLTGAAAVHNQETLPRVEASYTGKLGPVNFFVGGLYNQYKIEYALTATSAKQDVTVNSWAIGVGGKYAYGPFYVNAEGQYARNPNNGNGTYAVVIPAFYMFNPTTNTGQDADYYMAQGVIGFKLSDMISFEGGYVYQTAKVSDPNLAGTPSLKQTSGTWYLQSVISPAKNFYIVPELGEIDYQNLQVDGYSNRNLGNIIWFGIKWQIDF
jgi:hypothetical protein